MADVDEMLLRDQKYTELELRARNPRAGVSFSPSSWITTQPTKAYLVFL